MKIAVASADGASMSSHFGQSACFLVFDVAEGKVIGRETRRNTHTAFAKRECHGAHDHEEPHSHAAVAEALRDCEAVLCGGMGWRAAADLTAQGIQPVVVEGDVRPEDAVEAYLSGTLKAAGRLCQCHHGH